MDPDRVVLRQRRYGLSAPTAVELLGPGDVVRPWDPEPEEETLSVTGSWQVGASTAMAVIDSRILVVAAHRPQLVASLFARGVSRSRRLLLNGALRGIPGARAGLLAVFGQLAARWGRLTPEGVLVGVPLGHRTLAELTACGARPSRKRLER